jgi:hypothetical protein
MSFLAPDFYGRKRLQVVPPEDGKPVPPFLTTSRSSSPTMQEALANLDRELSTHRQEQPMEHEQATPLEQVAAMLACLTYGEMKELAGAVAAEINGGAEQNALADALHGWAAKKSGITQ